MSPLKEKKIRKKILKAVSQYYRQAHLPKRPFVPGAKIPYAARVFDEAEMTALVDSALDFWLTAGRYAKNFEGELSDFLGIRHCLLVNSGSSANLLAFMALTSSQWGPRRISRGDEVITTAAGFPTTVAPIVQYGAVPVFVDVTLPTYNIDCRQLQKALSKKTKAVMVAHTLGNPFDMVKIKRFCQKHKLWLIEDNCDALGSRYRYRGRWVYTGTLGDVGTSSFYPPHHITTGEGGAVYTHNDKIRKVLLSLRDWGRDCWCESGHDNTCRKRFQQKFAKLPYGYDHKYVYSHFGYNFKITDMQAAIGLAQLAKLKKFGTQRRKNFSVLAQGLKDLSDVFVLPEATKNSDPSWFGFPLTLKEKCGISRKTIVDFLESRGIQTRMLFAGNMIKHPCFDTMRAQRKGYRVAGGLKNTETIMNRTFWIGVYSGLNKTMLNFMVRSIKECLKENRIRRNR